MKDCIAVILGGGRGARLFPLTTVRSKPAVPIGAKYRLIDIPISNCLNSGLNRIFVLTQYNSESLNKHIQQTYKFDIFSRGFVTILAAEQTEERSDWFQGTADAVRKSMWHLRSHKSRDVLILSGDQLYKGDFRKMQATHHDNKADATIAVIPVPRDKTSGLGILQVDRTGRIIRFEEKPPADRLDALESDIPGYGRGFLASMGIYMFTREALTDTIKNADHVDFGRHLIPAAIERMRVHAHVFRGYWEDVGTIGSYFEANLALTDPIPPLDTYDEITPFYTHPRLLPATKIEGCSMRRSLVADGCILLGAEIERSVIGIRSRIGAGVRLKDTLVLGADVYESLDDLELAKRRGVPPLGVGEGSVIERAILDKGVRIGRNVRIHSHEGRPDEDGKGYFVRDGIVIVPKSGVIADDTVI